MRLAQGQQRSDAGEARTRGLSVSSQALYQALYHWATALPFIFMKSCIVVMDVIMTLLFHQKFHVTRGQNNIYMCYPLNSSYVIYK